MDERNKLKIAILYMVREYQPISYEEIRKKLQTGKTLPDLLRRNIDDRSLTRYGETYIRKLLEMGLVECDNKPSFNPTGKLKTTDNYGEVQEYLLLSLTSLLETQENSLSVNPIFGSPAPRNPQWARIFAAMPFKEELKPVFTHHIMKVADELGISCKRGDNFFGTSQIMHDVWSAIYHADLLIVDCTGKNPNVFYELGIAHTLGKKCILIAQSIEDVPFDLRHWRVFIYQYTPPGMARFESDLAKTIKAELGV